MFKIVHITYASITVNNGYGLQIESCLKNGQDVQIIDISALYNFPAPPQLEKFKNITKSIKTFDELDRLIQGLDSKKSLINIQIGYEWRFRKIFSLVAKYKEHHFSIFLFGQLPFQGSTSFWKKLSNVSFSSLPKKTFIKVLERIYFKANTLSLPKVIFYAGEKLTPPSCFKSYPINYFDYDYFLQNIEASDDKYIVFLDDGMFQHPDDAIVGNIIADNLIKDYGQSLIRFFDAIEKNFGMKVIVSGHPKITYPADFFGDRQIVKHRSPELVKNCTFAICHYSTSLSLAVCYEKPIVFAYNECIEKFSKTNQPIKIFITNLASQLKQPLVNIDRADFMNEITHQSIDKQVYDQFKLDYLTTQKTKDVKTEDVFMTYLNDLLK